MLKKIILTIIISLVIVFSIIFGIFKFTENQLEKTHKKVDRISQQATKKTKEEKVSDVDVVEQTEPLSILLIGVDKDEGRGEEWAGNSDTMILVTLNPITKRTTLTSIQRDLMLLENGKKLNSSYSDGGAELTIANIEDLLDLKIDKYLEINMEGLEQLVDAVGGIEVTNNFDYPIQIATEEPEYKSSIPPGTHLIDGAQALVYSRMRKSDPDGDYGRQRRQQEVIKKVVSKVLSFDGLSNYFSVLDSIIDNFQTDIPINSSTLPSLLGYKDAFETIENFQIIGENEIVNGASFEVPTKEHLLEIQNNIKRELDLVVLDELETTNVKYQGYEEPEEKENTEDTTEDEETSITEEN